MLGCSLPRRRGTRSGSAPSSLRGAFSYGDVIRYLSGNSRAFIPMYFGLLINCIALVGNSFWMAPFYQRTHGWGPGDFGVYQGWFLLVLAPAGLVFGGWLAERLVANSFAGKVMVVRSGRLTSTAACERNSSASRRGRNPYDRK